MLVLRDRVQCNYRTLCLSQADFLKKLTLAQKRRATGNKMLGGGNGKQGSISLMHRYFGGKS
jgi:hypothetical protein